MELVGAEIGTVLNYSEALADLEIPVLDGLFFEPLRVILVTFETNILGMGNSLVQGLFGEQISAIYDHVGLDSTYVRAFWTKEAHYSSLRKLEREAQVEGAKALVSEIASLIEETKDSELSEEALETLGYKLQIIEKEVEGIRAENKTRAQMEAEIEDDSEASRDFINNAIYDQDRMMLSPLDAEDTGFLASILPLFAQEGYRIALVDYTLEDEALMRDVIRNYGDIEVVGFRREGRSPQAVWKTVAEFFGDSSKDDKIVFFSILLPSAKH